MNTNALPSVLTDDNLLILLETFKNGLVSRATGKGFEEEEYQRIRKIILASPRLEKLVPRFLKTCRTTSDFWQWIKHESPSYDGRRQILADQVNPMLDAIDMSLVKAHWNSARITKSRILLVQAVLVLCISMNIACSKCPLP
jgi:hypothetical protein